MPETVLKFKIEGEASSLVRSGESGGAALDAVRRNAGAADAAMQKLGGVVGLAGGALKTLATAAAGRALAGFVADGLAAADQTAKLARRLNVAASEMAAWRRAAQLAGASQEAVTAAVERGARTMLDAENGLQTQRRAIEQLGLRIEDLAGLAPDALFERMARAISSVEDPSRRMALAQQTLGRSSGQLATLFADYPAIMARARREARLFGTALSDSAGAAVEDASDSISRFSLAAEGLRTQMAVEMSPVLSLAGDGFAALTDAFGGIEPVAQAATAAVGVLVAALAGRGLSLAGGAAAALRASRLRLATSALTQATVVYSGAVGAAAARIRAAAAAQAALNVAAAAGRGALALLGGPAGLVALAGLALLHFTANAKSAAQEADELAARLDGMRHQFGRLSKAAQEAALAELEGELRGLRGQQHALDAVVRRRTDTRSPHERRRAARRGTAPARPPDDADYGALTQMEVDWDTSGLPLHEVEAMRNAVADRLAEAEKALAGLRAAHEGAGAAAAGAAEAAGELTAAQAEALALVPELADAERAHAETLRLADDERKAALARLSAALRAAATEEDRLAASGEKLLAGLDPLAAAEAELAAKLDAVDAALRRRGASEREIAAARARTRAGAARLSEAERLRARHVDALTKSLVAQGKSEEEVAAAVREHAAALDAAAEAAAAADKSREALIERGKDLLDQHEPLRAAEEARADAVEAVTAALESMVEDGLIPEAEAKERLAAATASINAERDRTLAGLRAETDARRDAADAIGRQRDAAGDLLRLLERLTGRSLGGAGGGLGGLLGGFGGGGGSALAGLFQWGTLRDAGAAYALGQSGGRSGAAGYAAGQALNAFALSRLGQGGFLDLLRGGFSLQDMGLGALGSFAGGRLGAVFGGLFGKTAENNWLGTAGGFLGSLFGGPLGGFLGSAVGSALDALFGGDGYKHSALGAVAGPRAGLSAIDRKRHRWGATIRAASGLDITPYGYKVPVEDADEFAREAVRELNVGQRSLLDAYREQTDAVRELVDGGVRGADALERLNAELVRQKQSAARLALAYHAAGEEVAALLGGAAAAIRESQLSPRELYEARRATADALRAELETTTDPERVRRIAADIERAARDAWALLAPDQQARLAEDFAGFLDASAAARRRLDAGLEELRGSEQTLADAADTMLDAATAFADGVRDLLGAGGGLPAGAPPGTDAPPWDPRTNRPAEVNG